MKKRNLNSKLKLNKMTISHLDGIKGGYPDYPTNSCDCGGGGTGGGGTGINTWYTHRPCTIDPPNPHCARTTCEDDTM